MFNNRAGICVWLWLFCSPCVLLLQSSSIRDCGNVEQCNHSIVNISEMRISQAFNERPTKSVAILIILQRKVFLIDDMAT